MSLILPKPHFSWSQYEKWHRTRTHREYIRKYFFNEKTAFQTPYLTFGKRIASIMEDGLIQDQPKEIKTILEKIPVLDIAEYPVELHLNGFTVKGFMDHAKKDLSSFIEYKTGVLWDQQKVDGHGQLDIYALYCYRKTGKIPEVQLVSMETSRNRNGVIVFTGEYKIFERKVSLEDLEIIEEVFEKTVNEISRWYQIYLGMLR